jgi:hypothetical protein
MNARTTMVGVLLWEASDSGGSWFGRIAELDSFWFLAFGFWFRAWSSMEAEPCGLAPSAYWFFSGFVLELGVQFLLDSAHDLDSEHGDRWFGGQSEGADVLVDVRAVTIVTKVTVVHYCEVCSEFPPWIPSLVA